jgi:hypothetical protein
VNVLVCDDVLVGKVAPTVPDRPPSLIDQINKRVRFSFIVPAGNELIRRTLIGVVKRHGDLVAW